MKIEDFGGNANCLFKISDIRGDMDPNVRMNLLLQADGDVVVVLMDIETGRRLVIEFCSPGSGGGRSPIIVAGLRDIIQKLVAANPADSQAER